MNSTRNKIEELIDRLMVLIADKKYVKTIESGHNFFVNGLSENTIEIGFNDWLIFDYVFDNGSSFINELYINGNLKDDEKEVLKAIENSVFSVFDVIQSEKNIFIKDIFTRTDYLIENIEDIDRNPLIARVINYKNKNYILSIVNEWAEDSGVSIRKSIYEKYNEFCGEYGNVSIEGFLKKNTIAIYKYLMIYKDIEVKSVFQDEEFYLHLATYRIIDSEMFNTIINETNNIVFQTDEYNNNIYELYIEDVILSEIEVMNDIFSVECRSEDDLIEVIKEIDKVFNKSVIKIKEEILNIEDLI